MARWSNSHLAIAIAAGGLLALGVALQTCQALYVQKRFSLPSDFDLAHPETILVTVECFEKLAEYTCDQTDEQYDLVRAAYQDLIKECSDCDTIVSAKSVDRPNRISLIEVKKMYEMGTVDFCFAGERLDDTLPWQEKWLHVATFSSGTVISDFGFSYRVGTKWLMKNRNTGELAVVIDSDGKGSIDPNGDSLEIYYPCNSNSEESLLVLLRTFGAAL